MSRKISKERFFAQSKKKNLKYMTPMVAGTKLTVEKVVEQNSEDGSPTDYIACSDNDGQLISIPVREFTRMTIVDGKSYSSEEDGEDLILPKTITVASSEDRELEGKKLFPTFAYNGIDAYLASERSIEDWQALVETGVKEDNKFSPVQNYTISVEL